MASLCIGFMQRLVDRSASTGCEKVTCVNFINVPDAGLNDVN